MNSHTLTTAVTWIEAHPWATATAAAFTLAALAAAGWGLKRTVTRYGGANVLTGLGAVLANSLSAVGMWRTLEHGMKLPTLVLVIVFPIFEVAVFASALRAGNTIKAAAKEMEESGESGHVSGGVDGIAVWVLTCTSAALSAMDAGSPLDACIRIAAAMVAAWLWERSLAPARRAARGQAGPGILATYFTRVRTHLLSWAGQESADEIARRRAAARASRLSDKLRALGDKRDGWRGRRISRRLRKAVRISGAAHNPADRRYLLEDIAASRNADALADLTPASPWTLAAAATPAETALTEHARQSMRIAETRIRAELPKAYASPDQPHPKLLFADVTPIIEASRDTPEAPAAQRPETAKTETGESARPHADDPGLETPAGPGPVGDGDTGEETPAEPVSAFSPAGRTPPETPRAETVEAAGADAPETPEPETAEPPGADTAETPGPADRDERAETSEDGPLPERYLARLDEAHAYIDAAEGKGETPSANGLREALSISRNWCGPLFKYAMDQRAARRTRRLHVVDSAETAEVETSEPVADDEPAHAAGR
ncbi:hypothetical protein [Streptomyces roseicoloratus]|uniref:hypothetical protein n=1 Tax=Streptomyces roseicoloratus TaxID=2508722 RepID=UPI001009EFE0|nr:hypothetical protein [Streptomyces roseicoloratus]